ncbi:hypothetical protein BJ875DRAFT_73017 [Amylocarpus encephaloides]|uniref:Uncharacterized protein n=1 Tax=Amylocarpus encephaloides TaxID=45428 RepID=A0A9P8C400_9HELO|nr:hypothetical protein BJ875DRAFT_73017 [Amylocarpus encephaloides]
MLLTHSSWAVVLTTIAMVSQPAIAVLPDRKLPDCKPQKYDTIQDKGKFWWDSGAEQYANDYIISNGDHSNWTQDLYMELFPDSANQNDMECMTAGAPCKPQKDCPDFNAIGKGGLFYLFQSMATFHSYVTEMRSRFELEAFKTALSVGELATDMKLDGEDNDPIDVYAILGAALSMAEVGTAANPAAAGAVTFLSGFVGIMGEVDKPENPAMLKDAGIDAMNEMIRLMIEEATHQIDMILAAVFGKQGHRQTDIPMAMRKGGGDNPAVQVFGWGVWLSDQPHNGLPEWAGMIGKQMKQAIYWETANRMKGIQVIIRDDIPKERCNEINHGWDEGQQRCYDMMIWNQKPQRDGDRYFGGAKDLEGLFQKYGMDAAATMKNSADCWEANGGRSHSPQPWVQLGAQGTQVPPCFFPAEVHKGTYDSKGRGIQLDPDYVGSLNDRTREDSMLWPY